MRKQQHKYPFGKKCQKIVDDYNKELKKKLIHKGDEPIYCNSVIDVNDEVFDKPLKK